MAISSPGIGSGLDVQSIVSQLVALEQRPLAQLQRKQVTYNSQLSSFGQLSSKVSALQDAAAALATPSAWTKTTSSSSDSASVSVTSAGTAASGDYSVSVSQLAKAQNLASAGFTDSSVVVGTGTLRIETGTWTDLGPPTGTSTQFSPKSASLPFDIEIAAGENTLAAIRTKINDAKAGVTASIVNDSSGARLVIRSNETGAENALRITRIDQSGVPATGGLSQLTYDPTAGAPTSLTQTVPALDAKATINGLNLVSASNTFKDVADGMSFTAIKTTTAEVTLKVGIDTASFKNAIGKFVAAYNGINTTLRELTKYDEASKSGGILQGDRTALTIQNQLRSLVQGTAGTSSVIKRLGDLGISLQRDGSLSTDDSKLSTALGNPSEVALAMASTADVTGADRGIAALFESFAKAVTGAEGTLTSRSASLSNRIRLNGKDQETFNARIEATRARLLKQYSALDTKLASLSGLNSYVSQQITAWNKSRN